VLRLLKVLFCKMLGNVLVAGNLYPAFGLIAKSDVMPILKINTHSVH
jgi:hypothetical protein